MRRLFYLLVATGLFLANGCGSAAPPKSGASGARITREGGAADAEKPEAAPGGQPGMKDPMPVQRKIIYTATLRLVVEDFSQAKSQLEQLVKDEKGAFVAKADVSGSPGSPRSGHWIVRVPAEQLETFIAAAGKLGEVQNTTLDAQDVTAEYYDVEADIKNRKVEEEAFLNLEKTATTYDNLLSAKREVSRVRNEIDRLQKRLNILANQVALSTVDIRIYERKDYVPDTAVGFGTTIGRTFSSSLSALVSFGKGLVLVVVALAPWLPLLVLVFGVPIWLLRRWLRSLRSEAPMVVAVETPATPRTEA
jgi:hypothetical protein